MVIYTLQWMYVIHSDYPMSFPLVHHKHRNFYFHTKYYNVYVVYVIYTLITMESLEQNYDPRRRTLLNLVFPGPVFNATLRSNVQMVSPQAASP